MKVQLLIPIVLAFLNASSVIAQNKSPKWNFGIGLLTTKCEFENYQIESDQFYPRLRRFGTGVQFSTKYKLSERFNLDLVFEASNAKLTLLYYGHVHQTEAFMPKFPIRLNWVVVNREKKLHSVGIGIVNYLDFYVVSTYYNEGGSELPERSVVHTSKGGWHPLAQIRYGVSWKTKRDRWQQVSVYFNKGFSPITHFTLTRITPPSRKSTFDFLGTYWGFEYTWYLKKNHS